MALVQITLTRAQQNLIEVVFNSLQSVKAEVAPMVKHIRKDLGTKDTRKNVDRFNAAAMKLGFAGLSWSDLVDNSDYQEFLEGQLDPIKKVAEKPEEKEKTDARLKQIKDLEKLIDKLHGFNGEQEFSIDMIYLRWLRDLVNDPAKVDLARRVFVSPDGQIQETTVPPSADMIEVFADLLERLGDAIAA